MIGPYENNFKADMKCSDYLIQLFSTLETNRNPLVSVIQLVYSDGTSNIDMNNGVNIKRRWFCRWSGQFFSSAFHWYDTNFTHNGCRFANREREARVESVSNLEKILRCISDSQLLSRDVRITGTTMWSEQRWCEFFSETPVPILRGRATVSWRMVEAGQRLIIQFRSANRKRIDFRK